MGSPNRSDWGPDVPGTIAGRGVRGPVCLAPCVNGASTDGEAVMSKQVQMDQEAADRINAAAAADPDSPTAQTGFDDRARDAADRNEPDDD